MLKMPKLQMFRFKMPVIYQSLLKYRFFGVMLLLWALTYVGKPALAIRAVELTVSQVYQMLLIIPPIFILLGLLDVWVPRQTMARFLGEGSGIRGIVLSFVAGAVAAGPLYGAFPVAAVFLKKQASFRNVFIFLGAWSTIKVPMFLFEWQSLGWKFAITRLCLNIAGILAIACVLDTLLKPEDRGWIRQQADDLSL
ncbi:MAG: permease [Spirochaetales bacterium]